MDNVSFTIRLQLWHSSQINIAVLSGEKQSTLGPWALLLTLPETEMDGKGADEGGKGNTKTPTPR